jgi:ectoine hydroxylase-related dioxygenase (phytanoyl-CoA dioxygenase family)
MAQLVTFDPDHDRNEILTQFKQDGAVIIRGLMASDLRDQVTTELAPWVSATPDGRDDFAGRQTTRTGALVARSPACRDLVMHELVLDLAHRFLLDYSNKIQLHLTQVINIKPGQGTQPLHRDRLAWGGYIPGQVEPQFNTIWALTDFTVENGATRVVPGSPHWEDDRRAADDEKTQAAMSAGSVLLYSGSVIHGGGENRSSNDRTGINITYCLSWLRTEENNYLSCPPDIAKDLEPGLQELLGYTMGNYALGYYSDPHSMGDASDILPPEFALGRDPRSSDHILGAPSSPA